MSKISEVIIGDSGEVARNKINEAIETVETDATITGDGTVESPLSAVPTGIVEPVDKLEFNTSPPVITTAGTILWNENEYTIEVITGLGAVIQLGHEMVLLYYNDTGAIIPDGAILHPRSATIISGQVVPTPELADASKWELSEGTLSVATHEIPIGSLGIATRFGRVRGINTSAVSAGAQIWLSEINPGEFTDIKPTFPNYAISIGGSLNSELAPDGEIFVSITKNVFNTFNDAFDGAIRETFDFLVTSDGVTVTGSLSNVDTLSDLTLLFSDGFYTFVTTPAAATIALTDGTDSATTTNYVYIPISTKVLTVSTAGFPLTEHCKIAQLEVQSAATVQAELGAERNQNINDHIKTEDDNGHILHIAERVRQLNAEHDNGTEGSLTGVTTNGYIQVTGGEVWQLHKQTFASFSMPTRDIIITNDFTTANRRTDNLNTITAYSTGNAWSNEWSKVVIWGIANKTGEVDFIKLNLPSDGYNSEANAIADSLNYADYSIPNKYKGVGFLIAAFTIRISGGAITYNGGLAYQDLRGFVPNNIAGGGGGSGVTSLLGLSDVFIASYAGKKGQAVKINDLETGIESGGNVVGGAYIQSFSATPAFDFDNGNTQQITLTADITSWTLTNTLPAGSYVIYFIQDGVGGHSIPDGTTGTKTDNSTDFITLAGDTSIVNVIVKPDGGIFWSVVETITA